MKIIWSPLAIDRVTEIAEYISLDNAAASQHWVGTIFEKVSLLTTSAKMGRVVPEVGREAIREILHGNYRIVYRLETSRISILTIRHGKQILPVDEIES